MQVSENWGELLLPGLRSIFEQHTENMPDYLAKIYSVEKSTKAQEFTLGTGDIGTMDEWAGSVSYEDFDKGFKATYTHRKYSKGIQIERELVDDDQYAEIKKRVKKLSRTVYYTTQTHAARTFNNAANGQILGPDGKPLCAVDHPKMPGSASVVSNLGTRELNADNLEASRNEMVQWTDDKGNLILIQPDTLIVPTSLRKKATIIAETKEEPDTADHAVNVWSGGSLKVIEWPFLTDQNMWFLADSMRMKEFLLWFWRRKPDFADKVEFDDEVSKFKVVGRWSFGFDTFTWVYANNPS